MEGPGAGVGGAGLSHCYAHCPLMFRSPGPGARPLLHPGVHVCAKDVHVQPEMRCGGKLLGQVRAGISEPWLSRLGSSRPDRCTVLTTRGPRGKSWEVGQGLELNADLDGKLTF